MGFALETTAVGWLTITVGWTLTALALISVAVYIWSKTVNGRGSLWHMDDILLYLSFLLSLILMAVTTWAVVAEGQGKHQPAESHSQFELVAKSLLINEILWGVVNTFMRIGAILFLRRVFAVVRNMVMGTNILLFLSAAYGITVIVTSLAICQPITAGWDPNTVGGRCGNEVVAYLSLEIIAAILDLAITLAPLPQLAGLQMSSRRKVPLYVLFSLGSIVFIITGLRVAALNRVNSQDFSYDRGYIGFLSILGPLIAIICCCTTANAGLVYHTIRDWATSRRFSPSVVVWSRRSRVTQWRSTAAVARPSHKAEPENNVAQMTEEAGSGSTYTLQTLETAVSIAAGITTTHPLEDFTGYLERYTESRRAFSFELPNRAATWS